MSLKETGINSPLEMYKESIKKKVDKEKKQALIKFLIIFLLSHIARTLIQTPRAVPIVTAEKKKDGYTLMELDVSSIIPEEQKVANLINTKLHKEIEGVEIIKRELNQDGQYQVKLSIPTEKTHWIIHNQGSWKLIPHRKVIAKQRLNYEISF